MPPANALTVLTGLQISRLRQQVHFDIMALALLDKEFERNYNQDLVYGWGRIFRDRRNPLEDLSPELFKYRYRLTKEVVQDLYVLLNDDLQRGSNRSQALSVSIQVLITIRYHKCQLTCMGFIELQCARRSTK